MPMAGCTPATSATLDADGFLAIVDRKKELIINAGGKNMSPANIEARIKASSPLIGQACVIGDARPYNVALLVLDPDGALAWSPARTALDLPLAQLVEHEAVRAEIDARDRDRERAPLARRADQALRAAAGRVDARRRRADADDEAQAQADRREVRGADRRLVRVIARQSVAGTLCCD